MERLIDFFTPEQYDLALDINKHTKKATGTAIITGFAHSDIIKLHAVNLTVKSVSVNGAKTQYRQKDGILEIDMPDAEANLSPANMPRAGKLPARERAAREDGPASEFAGEMVSLAISYTFSLNENMEGAYLSTYRHDGKTHKIISTQFESHYARQVFPCVDEPAAKAIFNLKITIPDEKDTVLSNTAKTKESVEKGKKTVAFKPTPKMSTYLLAFCIGEFQKKSTKSRHGVKVTTYAGLNHNKRALDFATQIAAETLDYYDNLFGIDYPLEKLDQVAIPDFESGAMENWGLVTYRESCLLADRTTSLDTREYIATVITHELSHQWFGNLVTMAWWDDLWLNESFATVCQHLAVDAIRPEYHTWEDFFTSDCYAALRHDALPGVQAVRQEVSTPEEIATLFDGAIVYAKGAHLILMLIRAMGERPFFAGIKTYLKSHAYQNTTSDDLWAALQPHAKFNVKTFMHAWLDRPGYPVLKGKSQKRFLITGATDRTKWPIPKITDDMSGHYLIHLSNTEFATKLKTFGKLNLEQRLRLLIDRQLLSKTSVSPVSLLELLPSFSRDSHTSLWRIIAIIINDLKVFAPRGSDTHQNYQQYVKRLVKFQQNRLGVRAKLGESSNDAKLRPIITGFSLYAEHPLVTEHLAALYIEDWPRLSPETRSDIFTAYFRYHQEEPFDHFLDLYQATSDPEIKAELLSTLTEAKSEKNAKKLLKLLESPQIVRPADHLFFLAELLLNPVTKDQAYAWLYQNWDYVKGLSGEKTLDDYLRVAAAQVRTDSEAKAFRAFVKPLKKEPALKRTIEVSEAQIAQKLAWIAENQAKIDAFLAKFVKNLA